MMKTVPEDDDDVDDDIDDVDDDVDDEEEGGGRKEGEAAKRKI